MSDHTPNPSATSEHLPKAKVGHHKWSVPIVWIVPLVAAVVAGYLVWNRVREYGTKIRIQFSDANGLKPGETTVRYRGVSVGEVRGIELSPDQQSVQVIVHLKRSAGSVAKEGSIFWVVRPQVGVGSISGLGTILTGPHIEVSPGRGRERKEFIGLDNAPVTLEPDALNLTLRATRLGSLKTGSPIYYRGIEVGAVRDAELSTNSLGVDIKVFIRNAYANLIRTDSKFWNASGVDVKVGLFRGAEINIESLRSLISGGVVFATPSEPGPPVKNGTIFHLFDEPKKEWQEWNPMIPITPAKATPPLEKTADIPRSPLDSR